MNARLEPLPIVELERRVRVKAQPASLDEAKAERRELVRVLEEIQHDLAGLRFTGLEARRAAAKTKLRIVTQRLAFIKDWIKFQNRNVSTALVLDVCGGDLDNPVGLVRALREIIMREAAAGRIEFNALGSDKSVIDAATSYLQLMKEQALGGEDA